MRSAVVWAIVIIIFGVGYSRYHAWQANSPDVSQTANQSSDPNIRTLNYAGSEPLTEHRYQVTGEVVTAQTCYGQSEQLMITHSNYGKAVQCDLEQSGDGCSHTSTLKALDPINVVINHHVATRYKTATVTGWAADSDNFPKGNDRLDDCQIVSFSSKLGSAEDIDGNVIAK